MAEPPLLRRFPALRSLPRARLGAFPTAVEPLALADGRTLLVKRDDRSGSAIGGNKVRGLEWLLGALAAADHVLTVGPRGSTHALATARCARLLGCTTTVVRWNQEMNDAARSVDARIRREARVVDARWVAAAYAVAAGIRTTRGYHWIPAGGAAPLGILGHVNGALELAEQIDRGRCDTPTSVFVPYGTGGTAAGLALGFGLAKLPTTVVAVRVVPRAVARSSRLRRLARATVKLIERVTGEDLGAVEGARLFVEHAFYGGAYGRPIARMPDVEDAMARADIRLDDTYGRKALAALLASRDRRPLLWLTFDGRLLED